MDRLSLLVIVCTAQVGCQAPTTGFDPFAFGRQTRVPPPPTNVVGSAGSYRRSPAPLPPVDSGAATWPGANFTPKAEYWEAAPVNVAPATVESNRQPTPPKPVESSFAENVELTRNDRLTWLDPETKRLTGPLAAQRKEPPISESSQVPRLLPGPGPAESLAASTYAGRPISAPVRVRGFRAAGSQEVRIPAALAEFQRHDGLQQATRWQPRYDDVRR